MLEHAGAVCHADSVPDVRVRCVCENEDWGECGLSVSGARGLAAVLLRGQSLMLFDVQDDEGVEEEEEQEEEGEMEG